MGSLIGKKVGDLTLDKDLHIEAIRRGETVLRADPSTELIADDQLTIIGPIGELPGSEELADSV
jgi:Trk K+ transport system NAD-binding subunit